MPPYCGLSEETGVGLVVVGEVVVDGTVVGGDVVVAAGEPQAEMMSAVVTTQASVSHTALLFCSAQDFRHICPHAENRNINRGCNTRKEKTSIRKSMFV